MARPSVSLASRCSTSSHSYPLATPQSSPGRGSMRPLDRVRSFAAALARGLGLALLGLAFGAGPAAAQSTFVIEVYNFDFGREQGNLHIDPEIRVGDTVRWDWVSGFHSTQSAAG